MPWWQLRVECELELQIIVHHKLKFLTDRRVLAEFKRCCRDAVQAIVERELEVYSVVPWHGKIQVFDANDFDKEATTLDALWVVILEVASHGVVFRYGTECALLSR